MSEVFGTPPALRRTFCCQTDRCAQLSRVWVLLLLVISGTAGCRQLSEKMSVQPRSLRDVPAARLAFRLETDINADALPDSIKNETPDEPLASIKTAFETNRRDEALLRAVVSPDGQRALALYDPGGIPQDEFRIDLYGADGMFVRNVLPQGLSGVTPSAVAWSPDGQWIVFIGRKSGAAQTSPTPHDEMGAPPTVAVPNDNSTAVASPSPQPLIAPVPTFSTEQIYLCDRDGFNLKPLTTRDGLVYFSVAWAPDGHAIAALACKESELAERINANKQLAGRPRIIDRDGHERLLDDQLMDALPVWSPDSSKVATATESDVAIYDAAGNPPTGARLPLRNPLLAASATYDAEKLQRNQAATVNASSKKGKSSATTTTTTTTAAATQVSAPVSAPSGQPLSFNPVVRLEWTTPELLLVETGFIRIYQNNETVTRYMRWHLLHLTPQANVLG